MKQSDINWFRPLWRRVLVAVVAAMWLGFELYNQQAMWAMFAGGLLAYIVWVYFLTFPKEDADDATKS